MTWREKMLFSELTFIFLFLPITLGIYYAVPFRLKNAVLFISGVVFYAWGEPKYVVIMLASTLIDYCAGLAIHRFGSNKNARRAALIVSIVMNLSLLGVFKYSGFAVETVNSLFGLNITNPNLPLPIGISFFTFQSMSYTIDMYLGNVEVQKNPVSFAAFVTMFPQIVAGPIVRYNDISKELKNRTVDFAAVDSGISLFVCGLAKKVLIANSIGEVWDTVKAMEYSEISAGTAWLGIIAFTLQIYFDFSGYSDMACGMGKMLGFNFPRNFDYPYLSSSVSEFWRRWHITLGNWFKSYVYIPLGGNRKGKARTVLNLLIVWFLTGLWHGASMNFVLWGLYYGVLIIIERLLPDRVLEAVHKALRRIVTLLLIIVGWVIFEISLPSSQLDFVSAMFGLTGASGTTTAMGILSNYLAVFAVAVLAATDLPHKAYEAVKLRLPRVSEAALYVITMITFVICVAYLVNADYNPFLYFNF